MQKHFHNSFTPDRDVKTVILDGRVNKTIVDSLKKLNINVILTKSNNNLYDAISCHPDILLHPVHNNLIVVNPQLEEDILNELKIRGYKILFGTSILKSNYPQNIAYNVARVGLYAFHNFKYTDIILKNELEKININLINVKQGYAKCSTAIVTDNAIITSDNGIANAAYNVGMDILLIEPGNITLPGLNYGFIGGACGLISKNTIAFTGKFENERIFEEINKFLCKYNVKPVFLSNNKIVDIGSIINVE